MFLDDENVLDSLTYRYEIVNDEPIGIRIHKGDFCILEDDLFTLLKIDKTKLHNIIIELLEEGKILLNKHIIYHAWYGSSNGKLYKMKTNKIDMYSENLTEPCLEDDKLKIVLSSEAIGEIFKKLKFNDSEKFYNIAKESVLYSQKFRCFVQGIICGIDDSIRKINFGTNLNICSMKMPDSNEFLRSYWLILDVFSFEQRFSNALLTGQNRVNTFLSKEEYGDIAELLDESKSLNLCKTSIELIDAKFNHVINIFKIIRLVTKKPIWCSEIIRPISCRAMSHSNPVKLPDPFTYSKKNIQTLSDEDANKVNTLIDVFKDNKDDTVQLVMKHYDYSFFVPDDVSIVLLVTCLEILFHPGDKDELKNRIARNAAVFLGNVNIKSSEVFDNIKSFYDIRSTLVHSGKFKCKKYNEGDIISKLRDVVSDSIIKYKINISLKNISKDDFFKILNSSGFDSNPFGIKQ